MLLLLATLALGTVEGVDATAFHSDGSPRVKLADFLHHHETAYMHLPREVPRYFSLILSNCAPSVLLLVDKAAPDRAVVSSHASSQALCVAVGCGVHPTS